MKPQLKTLKLNNQELHLITKAIEQVTRLGIWNDTIEGLNNKINELLKK